MPKHIAPSAIQNGRTLNFVQNLLCFCIISLWLLGTMLILAVEEVALAVMLWLADAMQSWHHGWRCKAARVCATAAHAS